MKRRPAGLVTVGLRPSCTRPAGQEWKYVGCIRIESLLLQTCIRIQLLLTRTSSSNTVPMAWLSMPAGDRSMSGSRNLLIREPSASALDRVDSWLRN